MTQNTANVRSWGPKVTGAIYIAPFGTALPADNTTALASAFTSVGYLGEDGLEMSEEFSSNDITAYGGAVVRNLQTGYAAKVKFTMIETAKKALETYYGSRNVSITNKVATIKGNGDRTEQVVLVIDQIDGTFKRRVCFGIAQVIDREPISSKTGEESHYAVTVAAFPMSDGDTYKEYLDLTA